LFTSPLKDGHISVYKLTRTHFLPLSWEWVENELLITNVFDSIGISKGDIVKRINDRDAKKYFDSVYSTMSAATEGWLRYRSQIESLMGDSGSVVKLDILRNGITPVTILVPRQAYRQAFFEDQPKLASIREYPNDIMYINIRTASLDSIKKSLPKLQKSRVIICDLRVYPNNNHQLLNYLLKEKDTSRQWMQIAHTIYPDRERIPNWTPIGWHLQPLKPHLDAKIIFITDGSAISYAESYMSFVEHYKLGTIVGQPTAGTNGNVNELKLPGGYTIRWTGMKVQKHDGSVHHGVGILPNVYVEKTIKGVREGRDEFLEKALELAK
jgi:C-terminal processing protease CtpA/Prc